MIKHILILGASGTVGAAVFKQLSCDENLRTVGTFFSAMQEDNFHLMRFSVEYPNDVSSLLKQVHPDIVISSLRGDFEKQLITHEYVAKYLMANNGRLIYLSTANVYDSSWDQPHYEDDARNSNSDYGQFKIQCEDLLRNRMGNRVILLRLPFVWGRSSPRLQEVKAGCKNGQLRVYTDFFSNHVSDVQIAQMIHWIIRENKDGSFHVGTSDVISYQYFIEQLIAAMGVKQPEFIFQNNPGVMAVLSNRNDIPNRLMWDSKELIQYLCSNSRQLASF
ncbi:MAG: sugar nucleotide-binding protein [Acetatifactor sp.]|nr:sugar nucleotide-binding protein [Acetatifactor sp.]